MKGRGFVVSCEPELYTAPDGKEYEYSSLTLMLEKTEGGYGEPLAINGVADLDFEGMGVYDIEIELTMRDRRIRARVQELTAQTLVPSA